MFSIDELAAIVERDKGLPIGTLCGLLGARIDQFFAECPPSVFSSTPTVGFHQEPFRSQRVVPEALIPAVGILIDYSRVAGSSPAKMELIWNRVVDAFIDVLLHGDDPSCVIVYENDVEVLIGSGVDYDLDFSTPLVIVPFREQLLRLGGWKAIP